MNLDDSVHLNDLDVKTNGGMEEASIMISSDAMLNKQAQNKTSDNCVKHIIQSKATQNEANVHKTISEEETIKHNFKFLPFRESQNVNDDTLPPFLSGLIPSVTIGDGENDIFPIKENSCVIIDKFADDSFSTHKVNWVNDYGKHLIQSKATQNEANVHKTISEEETIKHNFQFLPFRESQNVNVNTLPPFLSGLIPSVNIIEDDDGFSTLCQGSSDNDSGSSSVIVVVNESEHDDSSILLEDYNHNNASSNYINVMKENVHNDFVLSERSSDNDSGSSSDIVVIDEIVHDDSDVLLKEENSHIDNRPFNDTDVVKENMNENYLISSEEDAGSSQSESSEFDVIEMKNFHDDCYVSSEEDEPLWSVDLVENENPCDAVLSEPRSFCCNENKSELSLNINNEDEHSYIDNNELYNLYEINNFLMNETIADICHPLLQSYTSENEHSSMPSPLMRTRQKFRRSGNLDDPESPHSDSELSLDINGRDMSEVSNPPIDHLCHVSRPSYTGENEDSSMLSPLVSTRQRLGLLNDHVSETLLTLSSNDLFRSFCFAVTLLLLASVAILVAVSHKSTQMEKIMDEYKTENNKLVDQMQLKIENYKLIIDLEEQIKLLRDENSLLNSQIHDLHKKVAVMFKSVETSFNSEIRKLKRIINDLPIDNMRFNRQLAKISNGSVAPAIEENKELKNEANITDIKDRNEDTFDESHSINNAKLANEPPKENEAAPEERNISLWPFFRAASRSQLRAEQQEAINWFLRKWRNHDITTHVDMIDKLVFATENRKPSDVDE
ncbi:hypothetical protein CDAR_295831 [Caerostris darwini]|uniref:Uncharacterized protein n=1 Tax=Caerostris darwini TaxID=1538125 RepID=A0AAV4V3L0_9ARAC|nr:hypothetical protein CDAR_295831 [Caerostris darwini]